MGARHILGNRWRQAQVRISRLVVTTEVILQFDHLTYRKEDIDEIRTRPHLLNNIWGRCLPFGQSTVPMLYLNVTIPWINASLWKWNKNQGRIFKDYFENEAATLVFCQNEGHFPPVTKAHSDKNSVAANSWHTDISFKNYSFNCVSKQKQLRIIVICSLFTKEDAKLKQVCQLFEITNFG